MRGLGWYNSSSFKVFFDKCFACLLFLRVERVYFGDLWDKRGFKVYGMVVGPVRRKEIVGFLGEYIFKIGAPIGDLLFWGFGQLCEFSGYRDFIEMFAIEILLREVLTKRRIILRRISL